jgi:hypothetical protein
MYKYIDVPMDTPMQGLGIYEPFQGQTRPINMDTGRAPQEEEAEGMGGFGGLGIGNPGSNGGQQTVGAPGATGGAKLPKPSLVSMIAEVIMFGDLFKGEKPAPEEPEEDQPIGDFNLPGLTQFS